MSVAVWIVILVISLFVLIKSADYFTVYSEKYGALLGISPFIIGVTIVSMGTSLPELLTGLVAIFSKTVENPTVFVVDNVIGSNISNILLVVGVSAVLAGMITIKREVLKTDFPLLLVSAFYLYFIIQDGEITRFEAVIGLIGYINYLWYSLASNSHEYKLSKADKKMLKDAPKNWKMLYPLLIFVSACFLYLGADWTVRSVFNVAELLNIQSSIITIFVVALGTSLPELVVSARAALRKSFEISVGNIIGSNIFNAFAIVGITGVLKPLSISEQSLLIALPLMMAATAIFLVSCLSKSISRFEGIGYGIIYVLFVLKLVQTL